MKLDAGDEETFRKINRPPAELKLKTIIDGLKDLENLETQTIFLDGSACNSTEAPVEAWLKVMLELKPKAVQIYTLNRAPADSRLLPVDRERMRDIFLMAKKAGLPVHLY